MYNIQMSTGPSNDKLEFLGLQSTIWLLVMESILIINEIEFSIISWDISIVLKLSLYI